MSYHSLFYTYKEDSPWRGEGAANLVFPLIVAMNEMGISGSRIRSLTREYYRQTPELSWQPAVEEIVLTQENWSLYLGRKEYYRCFERFFQELIANEPEAVRVCFSAMEDGIYAYDFCGLIRLAYAFESGQKDELARALAFLAAGYQPLSFALPAKETKVFIEQISGLREKREKYLLTEQGLFQRMREIAENKKYLQDFACLEEENLNIYTLRAAAIRLARETDEDELKYLFCAVHAFRVVASLFSKLPERIQQFYLAMQAMYLAIGAPALKAPEEAPEKQWPLIFQLCAVSERVVSLFFVYSCYRENQFAPSSIYSQMAYQIIHQEMKR